jgi:hypothetical protein
VTSHQSPIVALAADAVGAKLREMPGTRGDTPEIAENIRVLALDLAGAALDAVASAGTDGMFTQHFYVDDGEVWACNGCGAELGAGDGGGMTHAPKCIAVEALRAQGAAAEAARIEQRLRALAARYPDLSRALVDVMNQETAGD